MQQPAKLWTVSVPRVRISVSPQNKSTNARLAGVFVALFLASSLLEGGRKEQNKITVGTTVNAFVLSTLSTSSCEAKSMELTQLNSRKAINNQLKKSISTYLQDKTFQIFFVLKRTDVYLQPL